MNERKSYFAENCKEVLESVREKGVAVQSESAWVIYDDINRNQAKEKNGLCDETGRQYYGSSYIPVEKMNEKTTAFLKTIAKPRTEKAVSYTNKPVAERWYAESIFWDVNEEIASKYGVKIEVEQGTLYYRGTWLKIKVRAPYNKGSNLQAVCRQFCKDYGFDCRKELSILDVYELSWTEEQKKREDEDDRTDGFFDSMDF